MDELKYEGVHKAFGAVAVARGINLTIPEGNYFCLLGPSGCGKTSLLRMAAGLVFPDAGRIRIGDRDITDLEPGAREVGLAFQNYALYPQHNVFENLAFPFRARARRKTVAEDEVKRRVGEMASILRIEHILDRRVNEISGGQKQRVALGRALIRNPRVLLLDEPITHLDARLRYEMRAEIKRLHTAFGTTSLHVTHDQQEAMALADLIGVMRSGQVEQIGTPDDVFERPANEFVASFIGDPPMAVLASDRDNGSIVVAGARLDTPDQVRRLLDLAPEAGLRLGLRASHVSVARESPSTVPATVRSQEAVGEAIEVRATTAAGEVRFRVGADKSVRVGENLHLSLNLQHAHLFHAETGKAIGYDP